MKNKEIIYVVYDHEDLVFQGSAEEVAAEIGIKKSSVQYYATPTGRRRNAESVNPHFTIFRADEQETGGWE